MLTTLVISLLLQTPPTTATGPVRVYLKPPVEAGGLVVGDAMKERMDSTADLRKGLERYGKVLVLVDDPAQAQLTIEVLRRGQPKTGNIERSTLPGVVATEDTGHSLTVLVTTADGKSGEMTETNKQQFSSWGGVAKGLAWTIQDWIKDNRGKL
jgi:hypothetical protein